MSLEEAKKIKKVFKWNLNESSGGRYNSEKPKKNLKN